MFVEAGGSLPQEKKYISVWRRYLNDFVIATEKFLAYASKRFSEGKGLFSCRWFAHDFTLGINVNKILPSRILTLETLLPKQKRGQDRQAGLRELQKEMSPPQTWTRVGFVGQPA